MAPRSSPVFRRFSEPPLNDLWTIPGEEESLARFQAEDRALFATIDPGCHYHALQIQDFLRAVIGRSTSARYRGRRPPGRGGIPGDLSVQPRGPVDQAQHRLTEAHYIRDDSSVKRLCEKTSALVIRNL